MAKRLSIDAQRNQLTEAIGAWLQNGAQGRQFESVIRDVGGECREMLRLFRKAYKLDRWVPEIDEAHRYLERELEAQVRNASDAQVARYYRNQAGWGSFAGMNELGGRDPEWRHQFGR